MYGDVFCVEIRMLPAHRESLYFDPSRPIRGRLLEFCCMAQILAFCISEERLLTVEGVSRGNEKSLDLSEARKSMSKGGEIQCSQL